MNLPNFFAELQRRHVYKAGAAYAVAGWLIVQIVTQVFPIFEVSALAQRIIVLLIVAGFPITLILTWLFDITARGVVRTGEVPATGENLAVRRERLGVDRKMNYVLAVLLVIALGYLVPPLWGPDSFNDGAGMNRLITIANFVHSNMPNGTSWVMPMVTPEDAWDVGAYVVSQPRPRKADLAADFPNRSDRTSKPWEQSLFQKHLHPRTAPSLNQNYYGFHFW